MLFTFYTLEVEEREIDHKQFGTRKMGLLGFFLISPDFLLRGQLMV